MVASVKAAPEPRNDAVSRVSTAIAYLESASVLRSGRKRLTCYSPLLVSTQGVIRLRVLIHWGWPVLLQLTIVSVVKAKARVRCTRDCELPLSCTRVRLA